MWNEQEERPASTNGWPVRNKKIHTVTGPVEIEDLGRILTHEHIACDHTFLYTRAPHVTGLHANDDVLLSNVGMIRNYPYAVLSNLKFTPDIYEELSNELLKYKSIGGCTIVECSSMGLNTNVPLLNLLSTETNVKIIYGAGFNLAITQHPMMHPRTVEDLSRDIIEEMTRDERPRIFNPGFIGEIPCWWPIHEFEKNNIRAAAVCQESLDCAVYLDAGHHPDAAYEVMRIFQEAGGDSRTAAISHIESCSLDFLFEFMDTVQCFYQFDQFGNETSYNQLHPEADVLSDTQRIDLMKTVRDEGKIKRLLMSHDIHTKHRLTDYGGHGYGHIITNVIPRMLHRGFTIDDIDQITMHNPQIWLSGEGL